MNQGREEGTEQGRAQGKAEGKVEEKIAIARNLLGIGLDVRKVSEVTGLSELEVDALISK
ncbi:hypothetical protein EDM53_05915 [Rickettsiales endosymbiont of Peranema trichophorum]|uniref:hypothetical protein n=1 Tax=Rickettsiales endosymbiont of Peranema trichophorum TaxID=2486577 RepID=UPI001023BDDF|nr:hypothetical protein [Rickettsiales endosymbiont of Peranema trichophorum]RZI45091.1 hypothetical protein EDM53_05915 [Rickettsiales endosymbiont of Peranema trichophorum]